MCEYVFVHTGNKKTKVEEKFVFILRDISIFENIKLSATFRYIFKSNVT